ncbi:MAG TPA: hypothetical protein VLH84_05910 [Patescibacteria group bacterium]|nr:hypothetical protein [Patescibacteria group bacterium]
MDKRQLHHIWTRIRPVKVWYLLVAGGFFGLVAVVALRDNYVTMTQLRAHVYTADQNNGDVEGALQDLRAFVGMHMNTTLASTDGVYPPIQLKYTYARLQATEQKRVNDVNAAVYTDAQHYCEALYPKSFSGGPRVPCVEQYVDSHRTSPVAIPEAMYKFDFVSPTWSPDVAGWSLVAAIVLAGLSILRFTVGYVLRRFIR